MEIKVRLELTLARYRRNGEKESRVELPAGARVREVLEYYQIPETEPVAVIKNGRVAAPGDFLEEHDFLILLPPLEGG